MSANHRKNGKNSVGNNSRNGRGLTIADECALYRGVLARVARQLGVSRSYVSRAARGERNSPAIHKALEQMLARIRHQQQRKVRPRKAA